MTHANYPSKAIIKRVVDCARDLGLDVIGLEVNPNGTIRTIAKEPDRTATVESAIDAWQPKKRA